MTLESAAILATVTLVGWIFGLLSGWLWFHPRNQG